MMMHELPARAALGLIRLYQLTLSPFIGRQCRFHPTCSVYAAEAIERFGQQAVDVVDQLLHSVTSGNVENGELLVGLSTVQSLSQTATMINAIEREPGST